MRSKRCWGRHGNPQISTMANRQRTNAENASSELTPWPNFRSSSLLSPTAPQYCTHRDLGFRPPRSLHLPAVFHPSRARAMLYELVAVVSAHLKPALPCPSLTLTHPGPPRSPKRNQRVPPPQTLPLHPAQQPPQSSLSMSPQQLPFR